jgi:hypothetical protein
MCAFDGFTTVEAQMSFALETTNFRAQSSFEAQLVSQSTAELPHKHSRSTHCTTNNTMSSTLVKSTDTSPYKIHPINRSTPSTRLVGRLIRQLIKRSLSEKNQ